MCHNGVSPLPRTFLPASFSTVLSLGGIPNPIHSQLTLPETNSSLRPRKLTETQKEAGSSPFAIFFQWLCLCQFYGNVYQQTIFLQPINHFSCFFTCFHCHREFLQDPLAPLGSRSAAVLCFASASPVDRVQKSIEELNRWQGNLVILLRLVCQYVYPKYPTFYASCFFECPGYGIFGKQSKTFGDHFQKFEIFPIRSDFTSNRGPMLNPLEFECKTRSTPPWQKKFRLVKYGEIRHPKYKVVNNHKS